MKFALSLTGRLLFALILSSSLLAGCSMLGPTPTVAPTLDQQVVIDAAVKTLAAQMTEEAIRNPSPTPTVPPATATPEPTATATKVLATPTLGPTATPVATQAPPISGQGLYAAPFPENKYTYVPNEWFALSVGFKNTGTAPWGGPLTVKLVRTIGETTVQTEATVDKGVEPGGKIDFSLWAFGSETLGKHTWIFQLYGSNGVAIPGASVSFTYTSE